MKKLKITEAQHEALEKVENGSLLAATLIAVVVSVTHAALALTEAEEAQPEIENS